MVPLLFSIPFIDAGEDRFGRVYRICPEALVDLHFHYDIQHIRINDGLEGLVVSLKLDRQPVSKSDISTRLTDSFGIQVLLT